MSLFRSLLSAAIAVFPFLLPANAAGPLGTIQVGKWSGGAFTTDKTGAFSHCAADQRFDTGVTLTLGETSRGTWLLALADPSLDLPKEKSFALDVTFDGGAQFHLVAVGTSQVMAAGVPDPVVGQLRKSHLIFVQGKNHSYEFPLRSAETLVAVIENCVARMNENGLAGAGDFSTSPKTSASSKRSAPAAPLNPAKSGGEPEPASAGPTRLADVSGTGFLISKEGHIVTNNHVIKGCIGNVQGNFVGEAPKKLRVVATDETNDLALLQAKGAKKTFKEPAMMRDTPVQSGDAVVAIGFPYHGLLTSDFTITTGIISSLSGILNDTRFLQISAPVQPGNSGGPLLDTSGHVVGVVAAKLNALRIAKATGDIPENVNFAIKMGTVRDFLDNSVVPYSTGQSQGELKAADIASAARAYILLITCRANVPVAGED